MSALYGAAVFFVLLRVLSKMITKTFCSEDHMIIFAVILSAAPFACVVYSRYTLTLSYTYRDCMQGQVLTWLGGG